MKSVWYVIENLMREKICGMDEDSETLVSTLNKQYLMLSSLDLSPLIGRKILKWLRKKSRLPLKCTNQIISLGIFPKRFPLYSEMQLVLLGDQELKSIRVFFSSIKFLRVSFIKKFKMKKISRNYRGNKKLRADKDFTCCMTFKCVTPESTKIFHQSQAIYFMKLLKSNTSKSIIAYQISRKIKQIIFLRRLS